jgi:hypothetical protein
MPTFNVVGRNLVRHEDNRIVNPSQVIDVWVADKMLIYALNVVVCNQPAYVIRLNRQSRNGAIPDARCPGLDAVEKEFKKCLVGLGPLS